MRSLILVNGNNEEYDLLDPAKSPTFQVEGFGLEDETDFVRIGNGFFPLEEVTAQQALSMTLLFWKDHAAAYERFVRFARRDPLFFLYESNGRKYRIPCRLTKITKTEISGKRFYACDTTFALTGMPYIVKSAICLDDDSNGKTYDYEYDFAYSSLFPNTVIIKSESYVESPCILTIYGRAVNPVWRHYVEGKLVESGAYAGTIPAGHSLVIDSQGMPHSITEYDSSGAVVADRYPLCDFGTERFMWACEGENRYVVSHDDVNTLKIMAEAYISYETV